MKIEDVKVTDISFSFGPQLRDHRHGAGSSTPAPKPAAKSAKPPITWDDIAGCEEAIAAMREAVEHPQQHRELYAAYGQEPSKGVLLYGPPGNGKTLLARAAASVLGADLEAPVEAPRRDPFVFLGAPAEPPPRGWHYVKGGELQKPYVGESEALIAKMFAECRRYRASTNKPAVVFIDEADAVLGDRSRTGFLQSHLVPTFLAELDGLHESGAFVLLASNRPDTIDPAILRDGRIDRRILVPRPTRTVATQLLHLALRKRPLQCEREALVTRGIDAIWSGALALYELQFASGERERVTLSDAISGAMIVGLVQRAGVLALARDRAAGTKEPSGICFDDLAQAIWSAHIELARVQQTDLVLEKVEACGQPVALVARARFDASNPNPHEPQFTELQRANVEPEKQRVLN
jgi:proteasome-associated ATPase